MMARKPSHAIVNLAALDLRARADHRSELCSQLLMGEVVRVSRVSRDGRWLQVLNLTDGDQGWARRWGLVETSRKGAEDWMSRARLRVVACHASARETPAGDLVTPLFLNGRVMGGTARGTLRRVGFPDGRRAWVRGADLGPIGPRGRATIEARVQSLMGVPYLWGGRTPMGLDCSALTQIVLAERGIMLPRDAHEQFRRVRRLAKSESPRAGDLVFFGTGPRRADHVGVMVQGGAFAHARGSVRINSLDGRNALHDKELEPQWIGYGRPAEGA